MMIGIPSEFHRRRFKAAVDPAHRIPVEGPDRAQAGRLSSPQMAQAHVQDVPIPAPWCLVGDPVSRIIARLQTVPGDEPRSPADG